MKKKLMSGFLAFCMLSAMAPGALAVEKKATNYETDPGGKTVISTVDFGPKTIIQNPTLKEEPDTSHPNSDYDEIINITLGGDDLMSHMYGNKGPGWNVGVGVPVPAETETQDEEADANEISTREGGELTVKNDVYLYGKYGLPSYDFDEDTKATQEFKVEMDGDLIKTPPWERENSKDHMYYAYYWNKGFDQDVLKKSSQLSTTIMPWLQTANGSNGYVIITYPDQTSKDKKTRKILYVVDFADVNIKDIKVTLDKKTADSPDATKLTITPDTMQNGFYTTQNADWKRKKAEQQADVKATVTPVEGDKGLIVDNPTITLKASADGAITPPRDGKDIAIKYNNYVKETGAGNDSITMCYFAKDDTDTTGSSYKCACECKGCSNECTYDDTTGTIDNASCTCTDANCTCACKDDPDHKKCVGFKYDYDEKNKEGTITIFGPGLVQTDMTVACDAVETYDISVEKDSNLEYTLNRDSAKIEAKHLKADEPLCSLDALAANGTTDANQTVKDITLTVKSEAQQNGGQLPKEITVKLNGKELKQVTDSNDTTTEGYKYINNGTSGTISFQTASNGTLKAGKIEILGKALMATAVTSANTGIQIVKSTDKNSLVNADGVAEGGSDMTDKFIELKATGTDMMLPEKLTSVKMGNTALVEGTDYTYSQSSGKITFLQGTVDGQIIVDATPVLKPDTERYLPVTVKDKNSALKAAPTTFAVGEALAGKTITLSLLEGMESKYALPDAIQIQVGTGTPTLSLGKDYEYNAATGVITFTKEYTATAPKESELIITANAAEKCTVSAGDEVTVDPISMTQGGSFANAVFTLTADPASGMTLKGVKSVKTGNKTIAASNYSFADGKLTFKSNCSETVTGDIVIECDLVDETAPEVTVTPDNIQKKSADIVIESNEDGKAYVKVVKAEEATRAATAPTETDILAETPQDITAGTELVVTKDGLDSGTKYVAYVIVQDDAKNNGTANAPFTTEASETSKKISEIFGQKVTTEGTGTANNKEAIAITLSEAKDKITTADTDIKVEGQFANAVIIDDNNNPAEEYPLGAGTTKVTIRVDAEDGKSAFYELSVTLPTVAKTETSTSDNADGTKDVVAEVPKEAVSEEALKDVESIVIDATAGVEEDKAGGAEVTIPSEAVETLAKADEVSVTIDTPVATVTVPPEVTKALDEHSKANESEPVKLSIKKNKTVTPPEGAVIDAYDLKFVGANSGNEVKFDLSASSKNVDVKFKVKASIKKTHTRTNPLGLYLMEMIDNVVKYTKVPAAFDSNTGILTMKTPHFSTYVQMNWETASKLNDPDGKIEPAPLELVKTNDGMYYVEGAETGHWLYFYLNEKDTEEGGYGRVQPGVVKVNDDPQEAIFLPALDGTLAVWELKTRPTFSGGALVEKEDDVVLTNGLGETVESAMNN